MTQPGDPAPIEHRPIEDPIEHGPVLIVYSSPLCGPCERMKAWLRERNHRFTVRDVMMDEEAGELLESHDIRTTPTLQIGDRFVVGFDIPAIEAALAESG